MASRPVLIELIGPAGSGKTTVARTLIPHLREQGHKAWEFDQLERFESEQGERFILRLGRLRRWGRMIGALIRYPGIAWPVLGLQILHGPPFRRRARKAQRCVADFLGALVLVREVASGEVVIIHDGFLQKLWSLMIESRHLRGESLARRALASYYGTIAQRGVVLVVDDATSENRVFARTSKGRFNRDTPPEKRALFSRWLDYHRRLIAALPPHVVVGQVPAEGTPDEVARALGPIIGNLLSELPHHETRP